MVAGMVGGMTGAYVAKKMWNDHVAPMLGWSPDNSPRFWDTVFQTLGLGPDMNDLIDDIAKDVNRAEQMRSPLILDLDGDGVETLGTSSGVHFDHDNNGFAERSGWVGKDDGMLVWDRNANGRIDDGSELFGNNSVLANGQRAANGFDALAELDANRDGTVDAADAAFAHLRVWRDTNSDGVVQEGELVTLDEAGVSGLGVAYKAPGAPDGNGNVPGSVVDDNGNEHRQVGTFKRTDGTTATMTDVWFQVDGAKTRARDVVAVDERVAAMPDLQATGNVYSLHQAMMRDGSGHLKALVAEFANTSDRTERLALMDELIYRWAGVNDVDPLSRSTRGYGNVIGDARKLAALEAFLGDSYLGTWCSGERDPNPNGRAAKTLLQAFDKLSDYVYGQLLLQTHFQGVTDAIKVSLNQGGEWSLEVSGVVAMLRDTFVADEAAGVVMFAELGKALRAGGVYGSRVLELLRSSGTGDGSNFDRHLQNVGFSHVVVGDDNANTLQADGSADSRLLGRGGNDVLKGGGGNDLLEGGEGDDRLDGNDGDDVLGGGDGHDTLYGDAGNDRLEGGEGRDELSGGDGEDVLDGGAGDDTLYGGSGADTFRFGTGYGADRIGSQSSAEDRLDKVDLFDIRSSDVTIRRTGYSLVIRHLNGADSLVIEGFFGGENVASTVALVKFADVTWDVGKLKEVVLVPTDADDELHGYDKADLIRGQSGTDQIYGHEGDDALYGDAGNDYLAGGAGADRLEGGEGDDRLDGNDGDDVLGGGDGHDTLYGDAGNDRLEGGEGRDNLYGGDGDDVLSGGAGDDYLRGGDGADTYLFSRGDGFDEIVESDATADVNDVLQFGEGVGSDQLWFERVGDSLDVSIIGTSDRVRIRDWYYGDAYRVEAIATADGKTIHSQALGKLVDAMAQFAPPGADQSVLPDSYRKSLDVVIAAAWQ